MRLDLAGSNTPGERVSVSLGGVRRMDGTEALDSMHFSFITIKTFVNYRITEEGNGRTQHEDLPLQLNPSSFGTCTFPSPSTHPLPTSPTSSVVTVISQEHSQRLMEDAINSGH